MDSNTATQPIRKFIQALPPNIKLEKLILFGSYARREQQSDSDIDLALISSDFQVMSEDERLELLYQASKFIKPDIHPWAFTPKELADADPLSTLGGIRNEGEVLKF
jgi:predicted nucleotidyltransferase